VEDALGGEGLYDLPGVANADDELARTDRINGWATNWSELGRRLRTAGADHGDETVTVAFIESLLNGRFRPGPAALDAFLRALVGFYGADWERAVPWDRMSVFFALKEYVRLAQEVDPASEDWAEFVASSERFAAIGEEAVARYGASSESEVLQTFDESW
jgi:hypothetical protein